MPYSINQQNLDREIPLFLGNNSNKSGSNSNLSYDTPSQNNKKDDNQITSISSSDYALKVIFSQFEQMADAKMSIILNMGVVKCILQKDTRQYSFFLIALNIGCRC